MSSLCRCKDCKRPTAGRGKRCKGCSVRHRWSNLSVVERAEIGRKQSIGERRSWTGRRRRKFSKKMRQSPLWQAKMQKFGNELHRGKPNLHFISWWESLTHAEQRRVVEDRTPAIIRSFRGRKGFGLSGYYTNRFGRLRYDSTWERMFIQGIAVLPNVESLSRDFVVPYYFKGDKHRFLVDFLVTFDNGQKTLVEIKCPYLVARTQTKKKLIGVRKYAARHGMEFVLLTSPEEMQKELLCLAS